MELNSIVFSFLIIFFGYFLNKYILSYFDKSKPNYLIDNDYNKPQAFHKNSTYRLGGITIFFTISLSFLFLAFSENIYFSEYSTFCTLFFILGLLDDMKINLSPKFRLGAMIILLLVLIIYNSLYIERSGLEFLDYYSVFFIYY